MLRMIKKVVIDRYLFITKLKLKHDSLSKQEVKATSLYFQRLTCVSSNMTIFPILMIVFLNYGASATVSKADILKCMKEYIVKYCPVSSYNSYKNLSMKLFT